MLEYVRTRTRERGALVVAVRCGLHGVRNLGLEAAQSVALLPGLVGSLRDLVELLAVGGGR